MASNKIKIETLFGTTNTTPCNRKTIKYIIIHYTAGTSSKTGWARNLANGYLQGQLQASSDYTVDDTTIVQYNKNPYERYTWGVGATPYANPTTSLGAKYCGIATNMNSINIEVCSNKTNKKRIVAEDTDWYFTDSEVELTAKLVKYLMNRYSVPLANVIMHHQVTGKLCPAMWCHNESELKYWYQFKNKVASLPKIEAEISGNNTITAFTPDNTTTANKSPATSGVVVKFPPAPFLVKLLVDMNCRQGPTTQAPVNTVAKKSIYTISQRSGDWGKLKSGAGWIYLGNSAYTQIGESLCKKVSVTANVLNIRKGPGTNFDAYDTIRDHGTYYILEEKDGWGRLENGGWISLEYTKVV